MRARGLARGILALVALAVAGGAGVVSIRDSRDQLAVLEACDAARRGDAARAIELAAPRAGADATGRAAAECQCRALLAQGRDADCAALLESIWRLPEAADWVPAPDLAAFAIAARRAAGRTAEAAALARRAGRAHPSDPRLFALELDARAGVEAERAVLRELALRLPGRGPDAARMRAVLAQRHLRAGDASGALAVLGDEPPQDARDGTGDALSLWFDTRAIAHAMADDLPGVRRTLAAWREAGGDPVELRARYALALSISGLRDPEHATAALLRRALEELGPDAAPRLREGLVVRLVMTLASEGRLDEALAVHDRHGDAIREGGLTREELVRAARQQALADVDPSERVGTLRFRLSAVDRDGDAAVLAVSREGAADADVDAPYERLHPSGGTVEVERVEGDAPIRWVLRRGGRVLGSGRVTPRAGEVRRVVVRPRQPRPPAPLPPLSPLPVRRRGPGDGRTRLAVVLLDCGDWRLVRYLRERGELPRLGALLRDGHRAVLDSDPPLTAAALEALVWPDRRTDASLLGLVHRMGVELAGLASVGENPFRALSWVLPESDDLFSVIGSGRRSAANLLLAHGGIRAGRHGEVTGPDGARRRLPVGRAARDLTVEERARFPALAAAADGSDRDRLYLRTIAAELDATEELVREGALDLVFVRVEPLDILTHAHFSHLVADGQDDGEGVLYSVYRYLDARLAAIDEALDADDVLIVMSDHGIRTAMAHSRDALFVAAGARIPPGRSEGRPALRGVARAIADLLGVRTGWPDTGVLPGARGAAVASRGAGPDPRAGR